MIRLGSLGRGYSLLLTSVEDHNTADMADNSLRLPRPVNKLRTISASIEAAAPESVFKILHVHTRQSDIILEFPRKNFSNPSKNF